MDDRMTLPAPADRPPGAREPAAGDTAARALDDPRALTILTTEHWSLLSARSLVYNEAFSRAGMFLSFLAATLVALGLMSAATGFSTEFMAIAALILGLDLFIGITTMGRVATVTTEDIRYLQGMNRIRHAYHETVPGLQPYFMTGHHDDIGGVLAGYGADVQMWSRRAIVHNFTTVVGMLGVINAALSGVVAGIVVLLVTDGAGSVAMTAAVIAFVIVLITDLAFMNRGISHTAETMQARFPSPPRDRPG
jgi:hypothetical protein